MWFWTASSSNNWQHLSQAVHGSHKDFALNSLSSHLSTSTNSYIQSKIAVREIDFNTLCFLSLVYLKLASNSLCTQGWPWTSDLAAFTSCKLSLQTWAPCPVLYGTGIKSRDFSMRSKYFVTWVISAAFKLSFLMDRVSFRQKINEIFTTDTSIQCIQ